MGSLRFYLWAVFCISWTTLANPPTKKEIQFYIDNVFSGSYEFRNHLAEDLLLYDSIPFLLHRSPDAETDFYRRKGVSMKQFFKWTGTAGAIPILSFGLYEFPLITAPFALLLPLLHAIDYFVPPDRPADADRYYSTSHYLHLNNVADKYRIRKMDTDSFPQFRDEIIARIQQRVDSSKQLIAELSELNIGVDSFTLRTLLDEYLEVWTLAALFQIELRESSLPYTRGQEELAVFQELLAQGKMCQVLIRRVALHL